MSDEMKKGEYQLKSNYSPCLKPGCERDSYLGSRGLCTSHYAILHAKVKNGRTTWEELESQGLSLPKISKEERLRRRDLQLGLKRVWSPELQRIVFQKIS